MGEITLGPVVDQEPIGSVEYVEVEPARELATFAVHNGVTKLMCSCLEPIWSEDLERGYHSSCGRKVQVVLT